MDSVVEVMTYLVLLAKKDLGKWGDVILIALAVITIAGILTTAFVLWS